MLSEPSLLDPKIAAPKMEKGEVAKLLSQAADLLGRYGARTSGGRMEAEAKELAEKIEKVADFIDDDGAHMLVPTDTALLIERVFLPKNVNKMRNAAPSVKAIAGEFKALVGRATNSYTVALLSERIAILDSVGK